MIFDSPIMTHYDHYIIQSGLDPETDIQQAYQFVSGYSMYIAFQHCTCEVYHICHQ